MQDQYASHPSTHKRRATFIGVFFWAASCGVACLVWSLWASAGTARTRYPWQSRSSQARTTALHKRFAPPRGFKRKAVSSRSFAGWLRGLPMKPKGSPVMLYNGRRKPSQQHHAGVVALDVGRRDLQQCADAVMRLWGEYMWSRRLERFVSFQFLSGHSNPWARWARGDRRRMRRGRIVGWRKGVRRASQSYRNYRSYLWYVMAWTNTTALTRQLKRVPIHKAQAGDLLLVGWRNGGPGHAVLLLDEAVDARGRKVFLMGQSYMPAQSFHVLKAPGQRTSPWYRLPRSGKIKTPEWTFTTRQLYRLPHRPGTR